jgi:hypothetical protein
MIRTTFKSLFFIFLAGLLYVYGQSNTPITIAQTGTCNNCTVTIGSGSIPLPVTVIPPVTCAAVLSVPVTGALASDAIIANFSKDPTASPGFLPQAMLTIITYVSAGSVNLRVCNTTNLSLTPGTTAAPISITWKVLR